MNLEERNLLYHAEKNKAHMKYLKSLLRNTHGPDDLNPRLSYMSPNRGVLQYDTKPSKKKRINIQ